jgi:predicted dinucleotide-binding enzyme
MSIGIIGAGAIGTAIALRLAAASIDTALGGLREGGRLQQFPGGSFPTLNLIRIG